MLIGFAINVLNNLNLKTMDHYHNTTNQDETFVVKETIKCLKQEDEVMCIMIKHTQLTASDVWATFPKNVPLTSIRRALSNLCVDGHLMKANKTKLGLYGKPEHYYTLINSQTKMF